MTEKRVCRHCSKTIHRGGTYNYAAGWMHKKCCQEAQRALRKITKLLKAEVASIHSDLMLTRILEGEKGQLKLGDSITIRIRRPEWFGGEKP